MEMGLRSQLNCMCFFFRAGWRQLIESLAQQPPDVDCELVDATSATSPVHSFVSNKFTQMTLTIIDMNLLLNDIPINIPQTRTIVTIVYH